KDISNDQISVQVEQMEKELETFIEAGALTVSSAKEIFHELCSKVDELTQSQSVDDSELYVWTRELKEQVTDIETELRLMIPWADKIPRQDAPESIGDWETIPSLHTLSNFIYDYKATPDIELHPNAVDADSEDEEILHYCRAI